MKRFLRTASVSFVLALGMIGVTTVASAAPAHACCNGDFCC